MGRVHYLFHPRRDYPSRILSYSLDDHSPSCSLADCPLLDRRLAQEALKGRLVRQRLVTKTYQQKDRPMGGFCV